jgi:molybdenum cofactor cytidylyltransferase
MAATPVTAPCGAIILAAGQSRRMGSNKLLAELDGKPLIVHVVDAVLAADLPKPIMVLGHAADDVRSALRNRAVTFITAEDHTDGMAHSLAAGIAAIPAGWQAALICLGDMPLISPALLQSLARQATSSTILVPTFEGRRGNPVLWGRDYFDELAGLRGDVGARSLFERHADRTSLVLWSNASIHGDADTPEALAALRAANGNHP